MPLAKAINDQAPRDGEVHVLPVQGNVYMLVADGVNLAASIGTDGVLLVNSGGAAVTGKVQAALAQLAASATAAPLPNRCAGATCPGLQWGWASPYINTVISSPQPARPLRYIVNTNDAAGPRRRQRGDRGERLLSTRGRLRRRGGDERAQRVGDRARKRADPHEHVREQAATAYPRRRGPPTRSSTSCTSFRSTSTARR